MVMTTLAESDQILTLCKIVRLARQIQGGIVANSLKHTEVQKMMASLAEAKIVNLDLSLKQFVESARAGLPDDDSDLRIHILCCNEYFLVTDIVAQPIDDVRSAAGDVREALG
jgi:hypothetical protein